MQRPFLRPLHSYIQMGVAAHPGIQDTFSDQCHIVNFPYSDYNNDICYLE